MSWIIPVNAEDADTFWVSFWAALYSGIIYSIITGIIVGLVIWCVQSKVERKREIKKYEIEVSVFKSKLRMLIDSPDTINIHDLKHSLQPAATGMINFLKEYPIAIWQRDLASERNFMVLLKDMQSDYLKALSDAQRLDDNLTRFIRKHNSANERISSNDQAPYAFIVGRLFESKNEEIVPWLNIPVSYIPEWINECYENAIEDETIMKNAQKYLDSRKALDNDIVHLKNILCSN